MRNNPICAAILVASLLVAGCGGDSESADGGTTAGGGDPQCQRGCQATLAANCDLGPPDQATCVSDCQGFASGNCASQYQALQECGDGKALTCSAQGIPTVPGCTSQQNAFVSCVSQ